MKLRRGRCRSQPFATKERYGCGSAACRYTSTMQNAPFFTKLFGEFVTFQWADRVVGPYNSIALPVGAHDSVRPQDIPVLRESSANLPTSAPAAKCAGAIEFAKEFRKTAAFCRAEQSPAPTKASANPYCPTNFDRKANLPQLVKGNRYQIWCTITGGAHHSARRVSMCVFETTKKSALA